MRAIIVIAKHYHFNTIPYVLNTVTRLCHLHTHWCLKIGEVSWFHFRIAHCKPAPVANLAQWDKKNWSSLSNKKTRAVTRIDILFAGPRWQIKVVVGDYQRSIVVIFFCHALVIQHQQRVVKRRSE